MAPLADHVRGWIARHHLIAPGDTVVAAVSGGPDSLCMLHILARLRGELGLALHVAHLDHGLRDEAAAEARFVAETARAWGLPVTVEMSDVRAAAQKHRANLHQAARTVRYRFLARLAQEIEARIVAVAHNADDQAETVLMHLLRGAGPAGLRGMRPVVPGQEWIDSRGVGSGDWGLGNRTPQSPIPNTQSLAPLLIRPLLTITREEIERYCVEHQLQPRRDPSNADLRYIRNRIRHDLLPRLIEYNPHVVRALGRTAAVCAEEHDFIRQELAAVWPSLAAVRAGAVDFAGDIWRSLHPALQREALRQAYSLLQGGETLELAHVEAARAVVDHGVGKRIELPGGLPLVVGYAGSFTIGAHEASGPQLGKHEVVLPVPGRVALEHGWTIEATPSQPPAATPASAWEVYLDADAIGETLLVRRRRPGDRLRPAGGRGSRRLQDVLVDARVPRLLRDAWPLVATPEAIVWVAGLRPAEGFVATPATRHVLQIRLTPPTV